MSFDIRHSRFLRQSLFENSSFPRASATLGAVVQGDIYGNLPIAGRRV
jgi:hypothetical protein